MAATEPTGGIEVKVDPAKLLGVIEVIKAADRLANRVVHCDQTLTDSTVVEAADAYRAIRGEWKP